MKPTVPVRIELFAGARDAVGVDSITIETSEGAVYADLAAAIAEHYPELASMVSRSAFAANARYVTANQPLDPADEIALIPPVSGG